MKYELIHITEYAHESPVSSARCVIRLTPRDDADQTLIRSALEITPRPEATREFSDFFGNRISEARVVAPHARLRIAMSARVDVHRASPPAAGLTPKWESARQAAVGIASIEPDSPAHFLFESRLVRLHSPLTEYARKSYPVGRTALEGAKDLMNRIHADFKFDPRATEVSTPLAEAFEARGGVCQDFAHIMIAGMRGLGLPAAYVSGYIRTNPPPGMPRLEGVDASHAWVAAWCGQEFGWLHLDPTNALMVADQHIVVALGRDYADVSPVDGVIHGGGRQNLKVSVTVRPIES